MGLKTRGKYDIKSAKKGSFSFPHPPARENLNEKLYAQDVIICAITIITEVRVSKFKLLNIIAQVICFDLLRRIEDFR